MKKYAIIILILQPLIFILPQSNHFTNKKVRFQFENLSIDDGLSQGNARCILQDKQGFLWIGTQDGLNRYDGYNFVVFKSIINDSTSISHNFIYALAEDKDGNIWIATGSGISKYIPKANKFIRYQKNSGNSNFITTLYIFVDSENHVWASNYLIGLSEYNLQTDNFISFVHDPEDPESISSNIINSIYEDKSGRLWLGSGDAGLILFDRKNGIFKNYSKKNGFISDNVTSICNDKKGNLIIGTADGLSILDSSGHFANYYKNEPDGLNSSKIKMVFCDNSGNLFVGTENNGLNYLPAEDKNFYHYMLGDNTPSAINDNKIFSMYQDRSGIVWIGTSRGLNKIKKTKKSF